MKKQRTSFALSEEALELLKILADSKERSQANMLEVLIKDACAKGKIKLR